MPVYEFDGFIPVIHESSFIHPLAAVTGNVIIGKDCYIGPGAAVRGDWGEIIIEDGCNIQENCTLHMFPGMQVLLKESSHIGHGAVVHGATIGKNCLIGMNAVIMDEAVIGDESVVGALSFIKAQTVIPPRSVVTGKGKIVKEVTDEMLAWKTTGTKLYQQLPSQMKSVFKECEPLREIPAGRKKQAMNYHTWEQVKQNRKGDNKSLTD